MPRSLSDQLEELGMAFIYATILIGSVGFGLWSLINTSDLDITQSLAWGLILTFCVLGAAWSFIGAMKVERERGKR
jgi:hypothetical protein